MQHIMKKQDFEKKRKRVIAFVATLDLSKLLFIIVCGNEVLSTHFVIVKVVIKFIKRAASTELAYWRPNKFRINQKGKCFLDLSFNLFLKCL